MTLGLNLTYAETLLWFTPLHRYCDSYSPQKFNLNHVSSSGTVSTIEDLYEEVVIYRENIRVAELERFCVKWNTKSLSQVIGARAVNAWHGVWCDVCVRLCVCHYGTWKTQFLHWRSTAHTLLCTSAWMSLHSCSLLIACVYMTFIQLLFCVTHCQGKASRQSAWLHMVWRHPLRADIARSIPHWLYTVPRNNPLYWPEPQPVEHKRDRSKWHKQKKDDIQHHP